MRQLNCFLKTLVLLSLSAFWVVNLGVLSFVKNGLCGSIEEGISVKEVEVDSSEVKGQMGIYDEITISVGNERYQINTYKDLLSRKFFTGEVTGRVRVEFSDSSRNYEEEVKSDVRVSVFYSYDRNGFLTSADMVFIIKERNFEENEIRVNIPGEDLYSKIGSQIEVKNEGLKKILLLAFADEENPGRDEVLWHDSDNIVGLRLKARINSGNLELIGDLTFITDFTQYSLMTKPPFASAKAAKSIDFDLSRTEEIYSFKWDSIIASAKEYERIEEAYRYENRFPSTNMYFNDLQVLFQQGRKGWYEMNWNE